MNKTRKNKKIKNNAIIIAGDYTAAQGFSMTLGALSSWGYNIDILGAFKKSGDSFRTAVHVHENKNGYVPTGGTYTEYRGYDVNTNVSIDTALNKINNYKIVIITGGRSPEFARNDPKIIKFIKKCYSDKNKIIGAVCHGPQIIISTNLKNIPMSGSDLIKQEIILSNNIWKSNSVVKTKIDNCTLITSPISKTGEWLYTIMNTAKTL